MTSIITTIALKDSSQEETLDLDLDQEDYKEPLITLVNWSLQGIYSPKADEDNCTICKEPLTFNCLNCVSDKLNSKCNVALGKCGHAFHNHCIKKWAEQSGDTCPTDLTTWLYETENCDYKDNKKIIKKKADKQKSKSIKDKFVCKNLSNPYHMCTNKCEEISNSVIIDDKL